MAIFRFFKMAAIRHFNCQASLEPNVRLCAKFRADQSNRLSIFKMAAVRYLGFNKVRIFSYLAGREGQFFFCLDGN